MVETEAPPPANRPLISLPFIIVVVVLAIGGYWRGPWLLTQYYYLVGDAASLDAATPNDPSLEATDPSAEGGGRGPGGPGGGRPGGGGQGFDPEAIFARRDADSNGILEGEELAGRIADRVAEIDKDGDGALSKEEFLQGMQSGGGAPRGRGSRPGGGSGATIIDEPQTPEEGSTPPADAPAEGAPAEQPPAVENSTEPEPPAAEPTTDEPSVGEPAADQPASD